MIFLLLLLVIGNVFTANVFKLPFDELPADKLMKIRLRSKLNKEMIKNPEREISNLENLKKGVELFSKIGGYEKITSDTLKAIEAEKREIEIFKEIQKEVKEADDVEKYMEPLKETVKVANTNDNLDEHQVESIKKFLLVCKFLKNDHCTSGEVEALTNDQLSSAIKILSKNDDLLTKISTSVKVQVWPTTLNIPRIISRHRTLPYFLNMMKIGKSESENDLIIKATAEMRNVLEAIAEGVQEVSVSESKASATAQIKDEINMRISFLDNFMKSETPTKMMTLSSLKLKMEAFTKIIDTFMEQKAADSGATTAAEDIVILKHWLFFNQMILAADWVTRSGKFVQPWPDGFTIPGYNIPQLDDKQGFFSIEKRDGKKDEGGSSAKEPGTSIASIASRITSRIKSGAKSLFGYGQKDSATNPTQPASDQTTKPPEPSLMSRALDTGAQMKESAKKLVNSLLPKKLSSRIVSSKLDETASPEATDSKDRKDKDNNSADSKYNSSASAGTDNKDNTSASTTSTHSADTNTVPLAEEKKGGFFSSFIPSSWPFSKPAATTTPTAETPKPSSWSLWKK